MFLPKGILWQRMYLYYHTAQVALRKPRMGTDERQ